VSNDPLASVPSTDALHRKKEMGPTGDADILSDPLGIVAGSGRGVNDPLISYFFLYRDGVKVYIYVNSDKNALIVTTVQP
jgi:hypothetical protein